MIAFPRQKTLQFHPLSDLLAKGSQEVYWSAQVTLNCVVYDQFWNSRVLGTVLNGAKVWQMIALTKTSQCPSTANA